MGDRLVYDCEFPRPEGDLHNLRGFTIRVYKSKRRVKPGRVLADRWCVNVAANVRWHNISEFKTAQHLMKHLGFEDHPRAYYDTRQGADMRVAAIQLAVLVHLSQARLM